MASTLPPLMRRVGGWTPCFVWFPARLCDGRWAWMRRVERRSMLYLSRTNKAYQVWEYRNGK